MSLIDLDTPGSGGGMPLGACLLANDLPFSGDAAKILQMRIDGKSWKEIGEEFGKSPSGARKLFTDLTGITDYKIKGMELKKLASSDLDALKVPKMKKPKPKAGESELEAIAKAPKITIDDFTVSKPWEGYGSLLEDIPSVGTKTAAQRYNEVIDLANQGKGYLAISQATGLDIAMVDRIVWQDLLMKYDGNIWKAWQAKKTSQEGIKAVTDAVMKARAKGATIEEISKISGIPEDVLKKILGGDWKPSPFAAPLPGQPGYKPPKPKPHENPTGTPTKPPLGAGQPPPPGQKVTSPYFGGEEFPMLDIEAMRAMNPALTSEELAALKRYTGSYYTSVNSYLRTGQPSSAAGTVRAIDRAMAKSRTTAPMTVTRGMNLNGFNMGWIDDLNALKNTVIRDPGYMSTSNHINGVFHNAVRLEIECPPGTKGIYVQPFSSNSHEMEFLMDRNQPLKVLSVQKLPPPNLPGGAQWLVKARVIV